MNYGIFEKNLPENIRLSYQPIIKNGGWHLFYFGDADFIINKIKQFSHQEYNNDTIEEIIKFNKDLFASCDPKYVFINKDTFLPKNYKMLLTKENEIQRDGNGNTVLAYYGKNGYYYNVTDIILSKFISNGCIIIPKNCIFNHYFDDPCVDIVKNLIIVINDKEYIINENRNDDINIHTNNVNST